MRARQLASVAGVQGMQSLALGVRGFQLPVLDPVVDDAGAAAEPPGGVGDADLRVAAGGRAGDLVGVADPLHSLDIERAACSGEVSALGEDGGQVGVGRDGAEFADQLGGRGGRGGRYPGGPGPADDDLVGGAGVPADPDPGAAPVGLVFCHHGRRCTTNNAAERALRCIAVGRNNWTFAGSDAGGRRAAAIYTLIETAKLNDVDPQAWLTDVLARLQDHPAKRIAELLPWNWKLLQQQQQRAGRLSPRSDPAHAINCRFRGLRRMRTFLPTHELILLTCPWVFGPLIS